MINLNGWKGKRKQLYRQKERNEEEKAKGKKKQKTHGEPRQTNLKQIATLKKKSTLSKLLLILVPFVILLPKLRETLKSMPLKIMNSLHR